MKKFRQNYIENSAQQISMKITKIIPPSEKNSPKGKEEGKEPISDSSLKMLMPIKTFEKHGRQ